MPVFRLGMYLHFETQVVLKHKILHFLHLITFIFVCSESVFKCFLGQLFCIFKDFRYKIQCVALCHHDMD